jgi:molecular chaperone GrpE
MDQEDKQAHDPQHRPDGKKHAGKPKKAPKPPRADAKIAELEAQIAQLTEALRRERADAENLRRRHDQQVANIKTVVKADFVRELLPTIDNVERALRHIPESLHGSDFVKGVESIAKQFARTLEQLGVQRIKTVGEPFDPTYHEAVSMEAGEGGQEMVSEELQAGYILGNHVIRHAMVKVRA